MEFQRTFILREIDNNFALIILTITVLFGLTAFFISFNISNIVQDSKRNIEKKVANWETQQNIQMTKIHKLEGDLNLTTYYGLQVSAELIENLNLFHSSINNIQSDIKDIKDQLKNKNTPLLKKLDSVEQYVIGLTDSLNNH
jgi:hypothetical protein